MSHHSEMMGTAEEALSLLSGGNVLDVATGSGDFINFLMENLKDYTSFTGIDCNEPSLEAARKSLSQENIHFLPMDASRMDFLDSYFDTVSIANSLHHMADLSSVLSEMMRVCKPGGHFIIREIYRDGQSETQLTHVLLHHWRAAVDTAEGITHHETFTRQKIIEITGKLGLHHLKYYEEKDLESDPRDPELIKGLDGIIDRYIQRSQELDGGVELCQQGEKIRHRAHAVGFHGATSLLVIGKKQVDY
jgi:ubiquinone/menaquinone biosynthesis C-methylase UbiE